MTILRRVGRGCAAIGTVLLAAACDESPPAGARVASSSTAIVASDSSPQLSASASAARSAPPASASAAVSADGSVRWDGTYDAKKAKVETPDKVKDVTWKNDDGVAVSGEGKLVLSVRGTAVEGTASGALGDQVVAGVSDGKAIRFAMTPKVSSTSNAMTCTGTIDLKDGDYKGIARCVGANGAVVRKVTIELKRAG